jgi:hypothetical protein
MMPVLTGRVVELEVSERFSGTMQLSAICSPNITIARSADILHERGMGHYGNLMKRGRPSSAMAWKLSARMMFPWPRCGRRGLSEQGLPGYNADIRESASVAHICGQNLVAVKSMTASKCVGVVARNA